MTTDNNPGKLTQVLFTTFLALNIVLTSASLYTMYRRNGKDKKCKCQEKEQA